MGFGAHFERIDALVMGRNTLDAVLGMDIEWPYTKPVFVLSNTMTGVPVGYEGKIFLFKGDVNTVVKQINAQGYNALYIDGGVTIQNFIKADLIDEMVITTIPVLLGGGASLFGELDTPLKFKAVKSECFTGGVSQNHFIRVR
ncbi:MAG: dihydrofolate reductase family protein, partial [Psychrosphaera sp.]|nr:dihydrofolate reductase family protein [Psychrosphaera sp.]